MTPRPYLFGYILPLVLIPIVTFAAMSAFQLLKHILWPNIAIWGSHIHTVIFITAAAIVGGFFACRYLEAHSLLAYIVQSSEDAIIGITPDGMVSSWNRGAENIYGYSAGEVVGKPASILLPSDRPEDITYYLDSIRRGERVERYETTRIRKDGKKVHISLIVSPIFDPAGRIIGASSIARDITKRREGEEELKQANTYLENVFENSPDAIGIVDKRGKFIKWNKMAAELYGYSFEELRGKSGFDLFADRAQMVLMLEDLRRQGAVKKRQILMKRKDGSAAPFEISIGLLQDNDGKVLGSVSVGRDLSEIKNALVELKASNEEVQCLSRKNQLILDTAAEGIVGLDLAGRVTFINPAGAKLAGYRIEELIQKDIHQMLHHSRADGAPNPMDECPMFETLSTGVARRETDEVFWRKDGTSFPVAYSSTPILEEGRIVGAVLTFRDITQRKHTLEQLNKYRFHLEDLVKERTVELAKTNERLTREIEERKRIEEALHEKGRKFRAVFDQTFQFIGLITVGGILIEANRTALQFSGIQESDVIGKPFWETPWWTHSTELQEMLRVAVDKAAAGEFVRFDATHPAADGTLHYMDFSVKPVMDEAGGIVFLVAEARDIDEHKQADKAVLKANRVINALWECNNTLIHMQDELQLLREICRVIVEVGGYRMAWVGYAKHDADMTVTPVARYGYEDGYLEKVSVTWRYTELGRGPVGTCIRMGAPSVVRHVEQEMESVPWRDEAVKRGYASVIVLPVFAGGSVKGCLAIYAAEPDAFDADEVNLLSKLALNLSFGIMTLRTSQARKQAEIDLQRAHDELDLRVKERTAALEKANEELQQIPSKLIAALEEERKRLGSELHDTIGQTLAAVKIWVEMALQLRNEGVGSAAFDHLEQFVPILQRSIDETRNIYMGLRPLMLDNLGLFPTLEWLRRERMKLFPQRHIEIEASVAEEKIPENLKINIFRIAQEALNNIDKHSKAEWVDISLSNGRDGIELVVSDDGVGMDLDQILQTSATGSLGLSSMRERAELTGGSFTIESTPGEGTTIRSYWPVETEDRTQKSGITQLASAR
jgi:PAS domain S-box-containing protein